MALVIGNAAYKTGPLRNPVNDARAMAGSLRELGFAVSVVENGNRRALQQAMRQFRDRLKPQTVGLFYYSGHGMQVKGVNYLIPADAEIRSEAEVEEEAISLNGLLGRMDEAGNQLNIVILDACRDNPFARSFRSASRGLGQVDAPSGTLIAYSTAPGRTAADGEGANGLYTAALLQAMRQPGLSVEEVFKRVRIQVQEASGKQQVPWESSSLTGDFRFRPGPAVAAVAAAAPPPAMPSAPRTPATSPPPLPPGTASAYDGLWTGKYACSDTGRGDGAFERTLRLMVEQGGARFGRGDDPTHPGQWSADLAFEADGTVKVTGSGVTPDNASRPRLAFKIRLLGRADGGVATASGLQGSRECQLSLSRH